MRTKLVRAVVRQAGTVTLDYEHNQLLIDGEPFPFVLSDDPAWDKTDDGYQVYLVMPAKKVEVKGESSNHP